MADNTELKFIATAEDQASSTFEGLASTIDSLGQVAAGLAVGGIVALGGALAGIGGAAISMSSQTGAAINDLQAGLGLTREEAEALSNVSVNLFAQNWGNSLDEVNQAVIAVQQQFAGLGGIGEEETNKLVAGAFALRDSFGGETTEYISAARTLMEQFGLSGQQATDFITEGLQGGLNASGDFLDSIGEYSTQLANGGATAEQFFSLMETGLGSGVLGTDKAADSFKEFTLRIADGSSSTADALKGIGLSAAEIDKQLASGQITKADVFQQVIEKLRGMDDAVARDQIGVALLGTQYEDLGLGAALNIDLTTTKLEDLAGATDSLNAKYNNWPSLWEGVKRSALVALTPLGDKLLGLANEAMPLVQEALGWMQTGLPPIVDAAVVAIDGIVAAIQLLATGDFSGGIFGLSEDAPFITALFAGREILLSLWNAAQLLITGDFSGGIFGLAEDAPLITALFSIREHLQAVGTVIGELVTNAGPLFQAFVGMILGQTPAFDSFRAILADIFGPQLGQIIATFAGTWAERIGQMVAFAQQLFPIIQSIVLTVFGIVAGFIEQHGASIVSTLLAAWTVIQSAISTAIVLVQQVVLTIFGAVAEFLRAHSTEIQAVLTLAWQTIQTVIQAALAVIQNIIIPVLGAIAGFIASHKEQIVGLLSGAWQIINSVITAALNVIQGVIRTVMSAVAGDWRGAWDGIKQVVSGIWEGIKGVISGAITVIKNLVRVGFDALAGIVRSVGPALNQAGQQIIDGIRAGISTAWSRVKAWFSERIADIPAWAKQILGIHSPSRVMAEQVGKPIGQGIAQGIDQTKAEPAKALADSLTEAVTKAADAVTKGAEAFGLINQVVLPARDKMQAFVQALADMTADFWHGAQTVLYALKDDTAAKFADLASKCASALGSALDAFAKLEDFVAPNRQALLDLSVALRDAVADFWHRAQEVLYALKDDTAAKFADLASKAVGTIGSAISGFKDLDSYHGIARDKLNQLVADLGDAVNEFWSEAQDLLHALEDDTAARFAELASKAVGALKAAIEVFQLLSRGTTPDVPRAAFEALGRGLEQATQIMVDLSGRIAAEMVERAVVFADAVSKIVAPIKVSIDAFTALRAYEHVASERMSSLAADIYQAVWWMTEIAKGANTTGLQAAMAFSDAVLKVFGAIKAATDAMAALVQYEAIPPERLAAFHADFLAAVATMADLVARAGGMLSNAETWRDQMHAVVDAIKSGIDAISSLDGLNVNVSARVSASAGASSESGDGSGAAGVASAGTNALSQPSSTRERQAPSAAPSSGGQPQQIVQNFYLSGDISDAQARRMMQIAREEAQKVAKNVNVNQKMGRSY